MVNRHILMDAEGDAQIAAFARQHGCSYSAAIRAAALLLTQYEPIKATKIGTLVVLLPKSNQGGQPDAA